jgi:hypothetical protein
MFIPCIIRCSRNNQHYAPIVPFLYSIYWLLHVSAVVCHHQGASWIHLSYLKYRLNRRYIPYPAQSPNFCFNIMRSWPSNTGLKHTILFTTDHTWTTFSLFLTKAKLMSPQSPSEQLSPKLSIHTNTRRTQQHQLPGFIHSQRSP